MDLIFISKAAFEFNHVDRHSPLRSKSFDKSNRGISLNTILLYF